MKANSFSAELEDYERFAKKHSADRKALLCA
jgi:hypothetical protein